MDDESDFGITCHGRIDTGQLREGYERVVPPILLRIVLSEDP